ncbi:MAG: hypothetical protein KG003_14175 [Bacteroidetes bacterium]|nr:hypothetical protein [Bacteroidota bacterium]
MELFPLDNHNASEVIQKKENLTFQNITENDGVLVISNESRFSDIETNIRKIFGLQAKLFRRTSTSWIETKHTSDWTLQDQNNQGFGTSKLMDDINDIGA